MKLTKEDIKQYATKDEKKFLEDISSARQKRRERYIRDKKKRFEATLNKEHPLNKLYRTNPELWKGEKFRKS